MNTLRKLKEYELARSLRGSGYTIRNIALEVGVHHSTVQKWVKDIPTQHRLTDVNELERTATCQLCGLVKIRKNGTKWLCAVAHKANYEKVVGQIQDRFYQYLCLQECIECGNTNPIVLEFDHVRGEKEYSICDMIRKGYKWESILAEMAKCEVVCANCHRIRTNQRGSWFRYVKGLST